MDDFEAILANPPQIVPPAPQPENYLTRAGVMDEKGWYTSDFAPLRYHPQTRTLDLAMPGLFTAAGEGQEKLEQGYLPSQLSGREVLGQAYGGVGLGGMPKVVAAKAGAGGIAGAATRDLSPLGMYSKALEEARNIKQPKGTGEQFKAQLQKAGVKPDEMKWTGLDEVLAKPSVTKDEIISHLEANPVNVEKVVLAADTVKRDPEEWTALIRDAERRQDWDESQRLHEQWEASEGLGGAGAPKFQDYTLPGGENYREVLWKLPPPKNTTLPPGATLEKAESTGEWIVVDRTSGEPRILAAAETQQDAIDRSVRGAGEQFRGGHFDQPNILAHARVNDRVSANGEKTLFIEELQSDWAQKGRKEGFDGGPITDAENAELSNLSAIGTTRNYTPEELSRMDELFAKRFRTGIPSAPFVDKTQKWVEFGLKNLLKDAAEGGYDRVAWTPGKVQAERYDLSKQVEAIKVHLDTPAAERGGRMIEIRPVGDQSRNGIRLQVDKSGKVESSFGDGQFDGKPLDEVVGKETAEKLMKANKNTTLEGQDLQIGGEGMKAFYDKIIPNAAQKLIKKLDKDAKIERAGLSTGEETYSLWNKHTGASVGGGYTKSKASEKVASRPDDWEMRLESGGTQETLSIPITPKMREKILNEGQPLFAQGGEGGAVGATQRDDFEELLNSPPQIAPPQPQMPDNYLDAIAQGWT